MNERLKDRIAVVTGAGNGIGRASALCLARAGADLAVIDLEADRLASLAAEIEALGRRALPVATDCTDRAAVEATFADIASHYGRIDILFNNVGQSARERAGEFWTSDPATWDFVLAVSLRSAMLATRQVVGAMRARGSGKIINMSSESAFYGDLGLVDYSAAKMGVIGFTRALARELAPFRVNVNAVAPGAIATRAHDRLPATVIDRIKQSTPMGYIGAPEDVGNVVVFLASEESRFITGQSLLIDGGRWMI
ncbi:MAG: SDR family oxidoreductase [Acetobacteraceae bacterium]|nr:SDR family oxidoreductase [Acetobacteraceae bacterium]